MGKKMKRTRRSRGKENCNWDILYEKKSIFNKRKRNYKLGLYELGL